MCQKYGWRILPWEMDDLDVNDVEAPWLLRTIAEVMHKAGTDLKSLDEQEQEVVAAIFRLRDRLEGKADDH